MNQGQGESQNEIHSTAPSLNQSERSPESERRRNKGKLWRDAEDNPSWRMLDVSARMTHKNELAKAGQLVDLNHMKAAIEKEDARHKQYAEGKQSTSPIKMVDKRPE
ncbi:hypothetical protein FGB62_120g119 [Gracilaria domingensis]|nr:hypothetical protein FGB62_120g119 [Gracilaria domingensis]